MSKIKCGSTDWRKPCDPSMDCYIKSPQYFNCFCVYSHYIHETEHTLQEVAALMGISHTTVKQIEAQALDKIRDMVRIGELTIDQVQSVLGRDED